METTLQMKLQKVTMTGADNSVAPSDLIAITQRFPFVEWGILVSNSQWGNRRFPSIDWVLELVALKAIHPELQLSMHLCGKFVRDFCHGKTNVLATMLGDYLPSFERMQLNFHGEPHGTSHAEFMESLKRFPHIQYIFQLDDENNHLMRNARQEGINATGLIDLSHGAGVLPESWPTLPKGEYIGFAGGLGPDNLDEQLPKIAKAANDNSFWIDMETRIRSNNDQLFSLAKVEQCLSICEPFISKQTV